MALIHTILAPQESVNDQFLSLIGVFVKTGDFITPHTLIAELETSKAVVEVRADQEGYIKVLVAENTDIAIGSSMFEIYDAPQYWAAPDTAATAQHTPLVEMAEHAPQNTVFSAAALAYLETNRIPKEKFSHLKFVTTKDLVLKAPDPALPAVAANQPVPTKETNATDKLLQPISKNKKREFEYLHSVNSSSVISRLSVAIELKDRNTIGRCQQFITSTPLPSVIQEVAALLLKYPNLNSFYLNRQQAFYQQVHIGFALDDGKNGLKVAAVLHANQLNLRGIEEAVTDLSVKYGSNQLSVLELTAATFTITDLFNTDILSFHPLVNNNNGCILGISALHNGECILDLSFDHRITSGKEVAQFLKDLKYRLEARFRTAAADGKKNAADIHCAKCFRDFSDDLDGRIFFQKVVNSKYDGYICSPCLMGW